MYDAPRFTPVYMGQPPKIMDVDHFMKTGEIVETNKGKILRFRFENGYGASVITHDYSYGDIDQWELGVLRYLDGNVNDDSDRKLVEIDSINPHSVIGYLDWNQVESILTEIEKLPPAKNMPIPENVVPFKK